MRTNQHLRQLPRFTFAASAPLFLILVLVPPADPAWAQQAKDKTGSVFEVLEWSFENPDWSGNPFDLQASATFTHEPSGRTITTGMFYDGGDTWRFRFTPTRPGRWQFVTEAEADPLADYEGSVEVEPAPEARGFVTTRGTKFARQVGDERDHEPILFNVYQRDSTQRDSTGAPHPNLYIDWEGQEEFHTRNLAREAREHGMTAIHISRVGNQWLQAGVRRHDEHESVNPDLRTFRTLEKIIRTGYEHGVIHHFWKWGDEDRGWTPIGLPGGINGEVDRRLQRYIAARLGPLPGWTMAYGSDPHEWVSPEQVRDWHNYINEHTDYKHLHWAREQERGSWAFPTPDQLPVYSTDQLASSVHTFTGDDWDFYREARKAITGQPYVSREDSQGQLPQRPAFFERRFTYQRADVWDDRKTRRALWQFAMAGGVGAWWGEGWYDAGTYPEHVRQQMRTYEKFWDDRWHFDLHADMQIADRDGLAAMSSEDPFFIVAYAQDAAHARLDLTPHPGTFTVIAVDTSEPYEEYQLDTLEGGDERILEFPHNADWAVSMRPLDQ